MQARHQSYFLCIFKLVSDGTANEGELKTDDAMVSRSFAQLVRPLSTQRKESSP